MKLRIPVLLSLVGLFLFHSRLSAAPTGWFSWRGPNQNGTSSEKNLPSTLDSTHPLWTADFPGQSTAVAYNGRIYIMGYLGTGPELSEGVACFDANTGQKLWQKLYLDFLSDTIYTRYSTSSPTIDPETGNVYIQDTQGIFTGFSPDGNVLWEHSLMEEYGRLTFPNGRTASPVVDKDLVITRGITANWGAQGPAADRFYAFDKKTGQAVWASTPGGRPKDNSYSHPVLAWLDGKRVFYAATGDGSVVCVNVRTGQPIFQIPIFKAGINASVLLHKDDELIA
ncbi:MAG TPA: PQQ-binding-like beta-propeller repeat protein, partial [Candidatus Cybelea sp.]|nr:PQQ-binding-like beta-propeller repeat protein [Candidatus Cybelea sp.]